MNELDMPLLFESNIANVMNKYMCIACYHVIVMLTCLSLYSCKGTYESPLCKELHVDLVLNSPGVDELFSRIEVVPLEESDSSLVMRLTRVLPYKDKLFVVDRKIPACFLFDKDGNFIRQVGRMGNGPGEYYQIEDGFVDEGRQELSLLDCNGIWFVYDLDGKYLRRHQLEWGACQSLVGTADGNVAIWFFTSKDWEAVRIFDEDGKYVRGYLHQPAQFNYMILRPFYSYAGKAYLGSGCFPLVYELSVDTLKAAYQWDFGEDGIDPNVLKKLEREDEQVAWGIAQQYMDDGTLPFTIKGHNQTDKYYYVMLAKTSYEKLYCNVFYDKRNGHSWVFDKVKEGFPVSPLFMNDEYLLTTVAYKDFGLLLSDGL